jgi:dihydroorotate dehydrogenase electron transfer subunit
MVQVGRPPTPLLRRPFSLFGLIDAGPQSGGFELLYKVVGQGTRILSQTRAGQTVSVVGPLGRGFQVDPRKRRWFLAAGGIGVAPVRFLAVRMLAMGLPPENIHVFLGGQSRDDLLCRDEFEKMGMPVQVTTDDGSAGDQCLITDPLEQALAHDPPDLVYACGPPGMLQCVAGMVRRHRIPCQVSVESLMACGIGACLGCAVKSARSPERYLHVCMNGPVFAVEELEF